jgi:hypothetical protein
VRRDGARVRRAWRRALGLALLRRCSVHAVRWVPRVRPCAHVSRCCVVQGDALISMDESVGIPADLESGAARCGRALTFRFFLQGDTLFSMDEIDEIPADLAGVWSYVIWESAGSPDRSQKAADREYREGVAQMQRCLARGKTLDELWQVRCHSCGAERHGKCCAGKGKPFTGCRSAQRVRWEVRRHSMSPAGCERQNQLRGLQARLHRLGPQAVRSIERRRRRGRYDVA